MIFLLPSRCAAPSLRAAVPIRYQQMIVTLKYIMQGASQEPNIIKEIPYQNNVYKAAKIPHTIKAPTAKPGDILNIFLSTSNP